MNQQVHDRRRHPVIQASRMIEGWSPGLSPEKTMETTWRLRTVMKAQYQRTMVWT